MYREKRPANIDLTLIIRELNDLNLEPNFEPNQTSKRPLTPYCPNHPSKKICNATSHPAITKELLLSNFTSEPLECQEQGKLLLLGNSLEEFIHCDITH